jgi:TRAP-type C4-dicarboxylate transport system substrate-binding protein
MKQLKIIFLSLFLMAIAAHSLRAVVIKLGTIVPERSPWVKELKKLGREWGKITNGKVRVKIYAGGIAGSEEDMARKIRMGILGGAVFSNRGINNIYPDSYVLNIPFYIDSIKELDYIMEKLAPFFEKEIEKKGFKVIAWARAGWINFFTTKPIQYPEDLKKHKISFTTGAPQMEQAWKQSGYHIVPNELKDMMMGLQSGMVDAFYLPPIMAASGQFFPLAPNMCPLKIAPLLGGFVVSKRIWDRIPDQYKEEMIAVAQKMAETLYQNTLELEKEAIAEMKKHGLKINPVPPDALAKWKAASEKGMSALVGKAFSKEIFDKLVQYLTEFRKNNKSVN